MIDLTVLTMLYENWTELDDDLILLPNFFIDEILIIVDLYNETEQQLKFPVITVVAIKHSVLYKCFINKGDLTWLEASEPMAFLLDFGSLCTPIFILI